ncbi:hypothetical protein KIH27_20340 [Mycobacterium sp. M1]|uniref:Uncharacterized protein n=1 Tax=Mycolicibacter acidiphilus TaxID=2835306 RepID=A0ABS5RNP5_9MYCO|nr:hypothetical protein [Mycolicibacter acidiphilus]MBS9535936.1 hypothetical protein [Mycolicibacter acidiphilus]
MHTDFSSFVGAWALLLSCVVLVVEPIAPGAQWFNRALRLATGLAGVGTFMFARSFWHWFQAAPPEELADLPPGWDSLKSLSQAFLLIWILTAAFIVPAFVPSRMYRRVKRLLAIGPVVLLLILGVVATLLIERQRLNQDSVVNAAMWLWVTVFTCSAAFCGRWALQPKLDGWWSKIGLWRQSPVTLWLKSKLLVPDTESAQFLEQHEPSEPVSR